MLLQNKSKLLDRNSWVLEEGGNECGRGWGAFYYLLDLATAILTHLLACFAPEILEKKNLQLKLKFSISVFLFPHPLSSFFKKKRICRQCLCCDPFLWGFLFGIAAESGKGLDHSSLLLRAPWGQLGTDRRWLRPVCHRCNCFEKQVLKSLLTSCRKMKMGNTVIFYSVFSSSF